MKKIIKNENGIALVVTLILAAVAIIMVGILTTLVLKSTQISGMFKQYTTALEAARGGAESFIESMGDYVYYKGGPSDSNSVCKIQQDTKNWGLSCVNYMKVTGYTVSELSSHNTSYDIINYPDWEESLGDYNVYAKIVDAHGSADGNWYYTIDIVAQNKNAKTEKAWITLFIKTD